MLALFGFFFLFLFPVTLVFASFLHGSPLARFQIPLVVYLVLGLVVGGLLLRRAMRQSDPYGFVH